MENRKRVVAIDFGLARIGLAISDERKIIASPLKVIPTDKNMGKTIDTILQTLATYQIEKIVVGLPLKLNGQKGTITNELDNFLNLLRQKTPIPVETFDERFTTVQAERALKEANMNRKKRSKVIDGVAASFLLESFLQLKARLSL